MGVMKQVVRLLVAALAVSGAQALQITRFSPQGEVAQVRQLVAQFDQAAVAMGDAKAPAPLTLACSDTQAARGTGRWTGPREWVFDLEQDLPPGVRCSVSTKSGFKSPSSPEVLKTSSYQFSSGGPFVKDVQPGTYETVDEEQVFVLQLSGGATLQSVQAHVWCTADGVGERIPVRMIDGAQRAAIVAAAGRKKEAEAAPLQYPTVACNRRLTAGARMELVFGAGVATASGVANAVEKRFAYRVREPFAAEFRCERENAQAACLPIRPITLSFNAPVPRERAMAVRLTSAQKTIEPRVEAGRESAADALVDGIRFDAPLAENAAYTIELPKDFQDASGRALHNAAIFPLKVATAGMPPLAKFAAAPFGIVERFAEGPASEKPPALLPVTLRKVEPLLSGQGLAIAERSAPTGKVSTLKPRSDADIIAWFQKVQRYDASLVDRKQARKDVNGALPKALDPDYKDYVQSRMVSLLAGQTGVQTLDLPKALGNDSRPFEVVGIPLAPGFHVVEIASQVLGASLLDERHGASRTLFVRTSALVTNLGVHFKLGRDNAMAWVTSLDKGQPVQGATVRVSDCRGNERTQALTDANGIARLEGLTSDADHCSGTSGGAGYFVSARHQGADGVQDLAFTWSDWQKGIEPWRFNVPTNLAPTPDERAHTVFDRTLVRAGETVSMKHLLRTETRQGFALPPRPPSQLLITHVGSGQQFIQALEWRTTATGGLSAQSQFVAPPAAKLGVYQVQLREPSSEDGYTASSGEFRVEEFRLPVLEGRIGPTDKKALVRTQNLPTDVQVNYVAGGPAANLPVRVSAMVRSKSLSYPDYDAFSFQPPQKSGPHAGRGDEEQATSGQDARIVADKLPLTLNKDGAGTLTLQNLPQAREPQELVMEATYADPSGEVQTLRSTQVLWPSAVVAGVKTEGWVSARQKLRFQALALQHGGAPAADTPLKVQAIAHSTTTTRKRMVGGFYSYDNTTRTKDLGTLCSGKSDARGLLMCEVNLDEPGEVELVVTATDRDNNASVAASSVWVTRQGELWFGGEDHDRMDLLPEKKNYQPGEVAKFQVRMPFRFATALVAVEREGIIETQIVQLNGQDPTVSLKVQPDWGPNVYVSVLALRGRLRDVPWYSFFTWGYKAPREWWTSFWVEGKEYQAPTALVDLSKPAYRLGVAEIRVGTQAHQLNVKVTTDKPTYAVRGQAQVTITATLPGGKPAAHAEVALAAVDQALLELMPNTSWDLLESMLQRRSWGVETSTAQMEIIGRRHYGRKAVPAGGGGGRAPTRELLDTLLLWQPALKLDAQGQAKITVPLNDSLTTFQIVAVADSGLGFFGTGSARIRATQDLQIVSGLPPLVREDDQYRAQITLRNTTAAAMKVQVTSRAALLTLAPQTVEIPPQEAREVAWAVTAPASLAHTRAQSILWEIEAKDQLGGARDALKVSQKIVPAVPLTVQQATLVQLDGSLALDVVAPADALAGRGGLKLSLQPQLAEGLPGVRDWWARYPFTCLEQKASKAIGLRDADLWRTVVAQMPTYLDSDGLANYFPPRDGDSNRGSDVLSAYLLAASHEAAGLAPAFALPEPVRTALENGLIAFVEGRIERSVWSPRKDLDVRKIAAIEALSRHGKAHARMLGSITVAPDQWPTHAVIDWMNILQRVQGVADRDSRLAQAQHVLRARLSYQGTRLGFSTEQDDHWWWLMQNGDVNTARLMLAVMDDTGWKDDMARLASGLIGRQQGGAWSTTTANVWGALALEKFSAKWESVPVTGTTKASIAQRAAAVDWSRVERAKASDAQGLAHTGAVWGDPTSAGMLRNNSMFLPWGAAAAPERLVLNHQGSGKPWLTLQAVAAVPLKAPWAAGYSISKAVQALEQANKSLPPGEYTRGDVLRITLTVNASADMTWVAITDPIPGGATILGGGLGRDSAIAALGERRSGASGPAFEERSFEAMRTYYDYLPKGTVTMEYTVRLNNSGDFALPPTRVEALYAPEMFGESPNARVKVANP